MVIGNQIFGLHKTTQNQGLAEIIFIGRIVNDSETSYELKPGHKPHFCHPPYMPSSEILKVLLLGCVFLCKNFEKRKTSLRSPSLAYRVTASSPSRFDGKVGCDLKLKNSSNTI